MHLPQFPGIGAEYEATEGGGERKDGEESVDRETEYRSLWTVETNDWVADVSGGRGR